MSTLLRGGAARIEITPPVGIDLTGFLARQNPSIGVRDPLYVRALVLDDDDSQVAIVSCDLLGFDRDLSDDLRDRIAEETGIPATNVMLACTHTHGGPATIRLVDCGEIDPAYVKSLVPRICRAVVQAQADLETVTLALGSATSSVGAHNRRTPGDVIDPEIGLLRVDDSRGKPLAVLVNYTCHPTSLAATNRQITADYPGLVCQRIEEATGAVALFLMGAIGDVGPVTRGEESLMAVGNAVADAALAALPGLSVNAVARLETNGELLALPLFPLPSRGDWLRWRSDFERAAFTAESNDKAAEAKVQWAMVHWTERMFEAMQEDRLTPTVDAEIQLFGIGSLIIVGIPAEYFVELGLQIKEGLGKPGDAGGAGERAVRQVMIAGFSNGDIGYVPARRAYPNGGYEVADAYRYYGYPAAVAPEAGEMIVASALKMGRKLYD